MLKSLKQSIHFLICTLLIIQLSGCGTILYPERKGQKSGRIDAGVAILDGIGLLFFIVPGVIAFAVDFSNGTIYLPGTLSSTLELKNLKQVKFNHKTSTLPEIESIVKTQTGHTVKLDLSGPGVIKLKSTPDMIFQFRKNIPEGLDNHVVLLR